MMKTKQMMMMIISDDGSPGYVQNFPGDPSPQQLEVAITVAKIRKYKDDLSV